MTGMTTVDLSELIAAGQSGQAIISFPTDTVPALAVRPDRAHLIYATKRRSWDKPLILMAASAEDLWPYVSGSPSDNAVWRQVARQHWPGALTLVLPASDRLPTAMNPNDPTTLGIRVPNQAIARHILSKTGPLATTSANLSGQAPLLSADAINAQFPEVRVLASSALTALTQTLQANQSDRPESATGTPSTVVKWERNQWSVLRPGPIVL